MSTTSLPVTTAASSAPPALGAMARDLLALTKPRITSMVLITAAGAMWLAPGTLSWPVALLALFELGLVVGGANALNCWSEREYDARMHRTRGRPLAAGRLSPGLALAFGLSLAALAVPALALLVNPLTGLLALVAFVSYVWIYTPMKRRGTDALFVGAIPGAMPPLIGWVAVTGEADLRGLSLFALLFVWQLPHFLAIALYCQEDYARGGYPVFPIVRGVPVTRRWIVAWSAAQLVVSLLPVPLGLAGAPYGVIACAAGIAYLVLAWLGRSAEGAELRHWARRVMLASMLYLVAIFVALGAFAA